MYRVLLIFIFITNIFAYEITNGKTFLLEVTKNSKILKDQKELPLLKHPTKKDRYFVLVPVAYKKSKCQKGKTSQK